MKISQIETFILRMPLGAETFLSSQATFPERNSFLVRVTTSDGIVGWGEGGQWGPPGPVAACVNDVLAPIILGQDFVEPPRLWERLYAHTRDFGQKGTYIEAMSALDIAGWDIWGQRLGQPVHALLGGAFRDRIRAYATGFYYRQDSKNQNDRLDAIAAEAKRHLASGFDTVKMKVGLLSVEEDAERVAAVRAGIGPDIKLLVDANHAYGTATAIRLGRELEKYGVGWFEEPVVPEDRVGYRRVRDALTVPIAGGECEFTRYGFRDLFLGECVDIAQPDISACGGLSEWLKIQTLASAFGVLTIPHVWGSGIALATALQALAAMPPSPHTIYPVPIQNEPVVEYDRTPNALRDDLLVESIEFKEGYLSVPSGPGLGVTVNDEVLAKYKSAR